MDTIATIANTDTIANIDTIDTIDTSINKPYLTHMILSGGGFQGLVYIGVIRYLYQECLDATIKTVAGTSIGAIFATAFVLGLPCDELEHLAKHFGDETLSFDVSAILHLPEKLGLSAAENVVASIKPYVQHMTFLDISKKTGKDLIICATHMNTLTPTYFSLNTTPNVLVIDALKASVAIPVLVSPVRIGDELYIDGVVTHDLALQAITRIVPSENVLVIRIGGIPGSQSIVHTSRFATLINYIISLLTTLAYNHQIEYMVKSLYPHYIAINNIPVHMLNIQLINTKICAVQPSDEIVDQCIALGYTTIHNHFSTKRNRTLLNNPIV